MIHKVLDKLDRIVTEKRAKGELETWLDKGHAARYCKRVANEHKVHYPALMLYLEQHAPQR